MKLIITLAALALLGSFATKSHTIDSLRSVNALDLRVINKGWTDTSGPYQRLPAFMQDSVRPNLWERSQCSSGIGVRFATNSTTIGVRYTLKWNTHMVHMADTGLKGTDLYIYDGSADFPGDSGWRHVNTNRPHSSEGSATNEAIYVENMDTTMKEFLINLPLYDGVERLEVLVDSGAVVTTGDSALIDPRLKIVAYGTSILQGGCASRPGMASTNILSRRLNCEVVNIGISGEGKMDFPMARLLATVDDADMFLIDPVPNCTEMQCDTLTYDFIKILRSLRPDIPIVMLEGPMYPYSRYNSFYGNYLPRKNAAFRRNYERLKAENPANLYYVDSVNLDGVEDDGTVDGIHLTDLGFKYYADKLYPVLKPLLTDRQSRR